MLIAVLLADVGATVFTAVLLVVVGELVSVGVVPLVLLLVDGVVGAVVEQAAIAITVIAIKKLKMVLRFIDFLHL